MARSARQSDRRASTLHNREAGRSKVGAAPGPAEQHHTQIILETRQRVGQAFRSAPKRTEAYRSADDNGASLGTRLASLDAFTPARLLVWGSAWPHTQHQEPVDYDATRRMLDGWVPDPVQRNTILTLSAKTLYRFE